MTLAPERDGGLEPIRRLREHGVLVSLGHTDATYEEFAAGVDAGARMVTHLYNAMSPFQHRAPGSVGAALLDGRVTVGLIADGVHVHERSVCLAVRTKGMDRVALVTDMMPAAGMGRGTYQLGGQAVFVDAAAARLGDGRLAGSLLLMDQAVRNIVSWNVAPIAQALRMASEVPARLLGLERKGRLLTGADADLALFDGQLQVQATIIGGRVEYRREA